MLDHLSSTVLLYSPLVVHTLVAPPTFVSILQESRTSHVNIQHMNEGATYAIRGGRQGSREPKTAQCGAVLLNANVWDLRLFSVRFFAAGPKVDPRVKCIMS